MANITFLVGSIFFTPVIACVSGIDAGKITPTKLVKLVEVPPAQKISFPLHKHILLHLQFFLLKKYVPLT
jgi:hypothetical protein